MANAMGIGTAQYNMALHGAAWHLVRARKCAPVRSPAEIPLLHTTVPGIRSQVPLRWGLRKAPLPPHAGISMSFLQLVK
jgi:hypothetical protein